MWPRVVLWLAFLHTLRASCPPGCHCDEENKRVVCFNVKLGSIPVFLNPELRVLRLVDCAISEPDATTLRLYEDLEELDLSGNGIGKVGADLFDQLQGLRVLSLARNRLADLDHDLFGGVVKLESLDLSQNRLRQVGQALGGLAQLRRLNLSRNALQRLEPQALGGLRALHTLDLHANQLQQLHPQLLLELSALRSLRLAANRIEQVAYGALSSQGQLEQLDLADNSLRNLEMGAFTGLRNLQSLDLSANQLAAVPREQWLYVPQLRRLRLGNNPLRAIEPLDFLELSNLEVLHLHELSQLTQVKAEAFHGLCALRSLVLSHCARLKQLHPLAWPNCTRLHQLDLSHNNLRQWDVPAADWSRLRQLDLSHNPWQCECAWTSTLRRLRPAPQQEARCAGPAQMAGAELANAAASCQSSLASLAKKTLVWPSLPVVLAVVGSATLLLLLLLLLCARRCCRPHRKEPPSKHGRMPLYGGSCSFSGSIIYDKPEVYRETVEASGCGPCQRYVSALPQGREPAPPGQDYYSSLVLLPGSCQNCTYASPYASANALVGLPGTLGRARLRPPSFAAPPPPPSCPPPPLSHFRTGVPL